MNPVNDWFRKGAEIEAEHDITIGFERARSGPGAAGQAGSLGPLALGKLVELRRRERRLTVDALARAARVSVGDVVRLERGLVEGLPGGVFGAVATILELPEQKLTELAGRGVQAATPLVEAAARFTAQVTEGEPLRPEESAALSDFIRVLVE
jgi:hypothetical protein